MNKHLDREYDELFKVVVNGASGIGKTLLLRRFVDNEYSDQFLCTIGVDFKIKKIEQDGRVYKLQLWDTAGQERFRSITSAYYRRASGILICYSIDSFESFDHLPRLYDEILSHLEKNNSPIPVMLLCGLKSDLEDQRQVSPDVAQAFADAHNMAYIELSSKLDRNVEITFELLTAEMVRRKQKIQMENNEMNQQPKVGLHQENKEKKKKDSCC